MSEVKETLGKTLDEAEKTDKKLTDIAQSTINKEAMRA